MRRLLPKQNRLHPTKSPSRGNDHHARIPLPSAPCFVSSRNIPNEEQLLYVEVVKSLDTRDFPEAVVDISGDGLQVEQSNTLKIVDEPTS
jgi:hypothetical protein